MGKYTLFKTTTANKVLDNLNSKAGRGGNVDTLTPQKPNRGFDSVYAKVVSPEGTKDGFYNMRMVYWDDSAVDTATHDWIDATPTFDFEAKEVSGATGISADEVFRCELRATKTGPMWIFQQGGGESTYYIEITASTDINTYTGTIYDNPTDRTLVEAGVTVKAMQHDAGTIPNSDAGKGFFCNKKGDNYYITNYSVFYG